MHFFSGSILPPHLLYFNNTYSCVLSLYSNWHFFFVHGSLASFVISQYYLKAFILNVHAPTLYNALNLPNMLYYIIPSDLFEYRLCLVQG